VFYEELRKALRDDPEFGARFHTIHAAAAYVLSDLSPADKEKFEIHVKSCKTCARNVQVGKDLLKRLVEFDPQSKPGTRLVNVLQFVRWFHAVFGD
jgi:hypothetical protein